MQRTLLDHRLHRNDASVILTTPLQKGVFYLFFMGLVKFFVTVLYEIVTITTVCEVI